ncbi:aminodeoxychorismate synthase component I [Halobacillus fulvus]|nr:aminodeoxychorismate synthase component I [Halobacillus fulvus]
MNPDVTLLFEFSNAKGEIEPKAFRSPIKILTTDRIEDVQPIFEEVERLLEEGFYAAGYVSYEAAPAFDEAFSVYRNPNWPLVWFGIFSNPVSSFDNAALKDFRVSDWRLKGDFEQYQTGIENIKDAIERGDTYQVNYTTRMEAKFSGDDFAFYRQLTRRQQSAYSAYLKMGERRLLSASPELFFRVDGQTLTTKPMKGTAKRGRYGGEDLAAIQHLKTSEKEQAENLMIVDLLRNDVGRIAKPGSVKVPRLFEVETYPTVHQMTSTIQADLPDRTSLFDVFRALFPCGSITGAPKVRTMEYIQQLEATPRDVYCGAIGYMTPGKEAVFNVPIRTVLLDGDQAIYGTGGGVTWDSTSQGEYEELQTKARLLTEQRADFELLETMKLEDGAIPLVDYHLSRVEQSALYFGYPLDRKALEEGLNRIASAYPNGLYKVRMLVDSNGKERIEVTEISPPQGSVICSLATSPVDEQDPFLFHKTTHRLVYEQHQNPDAFAVLLWNTKQELTEFTIANLVVKVDGEYYTPPISSGLLAGTFREKLLKEGAITEKVLYKKDLTLFEEVWMINGVRGWVKVELHT